MFASLPQVCLKALAVQLPEKIIHFADTSYAGVDAEKKAKLTSVIGFGTRHVTTSETTLDLCEAAVRKLDAEVLQADALVFVTQTPDYLQPGNACVLHGRLHMQASCYCVDVSAGCNGYVQGLFTAHQLLQLEHVKSVLLCVGDTISKTVNPADSTVAPVFGDGGSASWLTKDTNANAYFSFGTDGTKYNKLFIENGGYRNPDVHPHTLHMDGMEVMQMALQRVPDAIRNLLDEADVSMNQVDYFLFHQANNFIVESLAKNLGVPLEKVPLVFSQFGNQSSASIPFAMAYGIPAQDKQRLLLSGFGVGFAWAHALLQTNDLKIYR